MDFPDLVARARALTTAGGRRVLGIAGPPGAGKSTLAARLAGALAPGLAVVVPMDGFHLAQAELVRLGRADRKGAPDTFDAAGYAALLRRLREPAAPVYRQDSDAPVHPQDSDAPVRPPDHGAPVYAPAFDRALEEPVAGSIAVGPDVPLVITEGNYLLYGAGEWRHVRPLLDETWYLAPDDSVRVERLVARHVRHGRSPDEAAAWVSRSDEANARLIAATRRHADLVVR
ncbi:nucleoside triphosphate hydrolase [Streptomyces sp. NRRL S-87]|uniref:nucleoside triphosphate hydrolase n=1 Tax=Streptomyces sp. NRRL S-87 TaxID=1463920 RepID=UPI0004C0A0CA|nr:nucleoside triphosphate hydrolase [Streptomyces sp. NRRL S-87]